MMISVLVLSSSSPLFFGRSVEVVAPPPLAETAARSSVSAELTTGVTGGKRASAAFGAGVDVGALQRSEV